MTEPAIASELESGGLWRDVVNFLGDREFTPHDYLPLLEAVLPKWSPWTYFMKQAGLKLARPSERAEIVADAARANLAWDIWIHRREGLRAYLKSVAKRRVDDVELRAWWVEGDRSERKAIWSGGYREDAQRKRFERLVPIARDEVDRVILDFPGRGGAAEEDRKYLIEWIRKDLDWLEDFEHLRALARKTWPATPRDRLPWTPEDLEFVNQQFEEQAPTLVSPDEKPMSIDPFELTVWNEEQSLGFPLDGLRYCLLVLVRAMVVDFADEILEKTRRPSARGSLSCQECGRFVGRRALGYGQLYCSDRCKKRVAKRRYRNRIRVSHGRRPSVSGSSAAEPRSPLKGVV